MVSQQELYNIDHLTLLISIILAQIFSIIVYMLHISPCAPRGLTDENNNNIAFKRLLHVGQEPKRSKPGTQGHDI